MKLAFTICDALQTSYAGGVADLQTAIVEIPDEQIPKIVREYLDSQRIADPTRGNFCYKSCSVSIVVSQDQ
jgi:predicted transcriptional regulator of viral defense system